MKETDFSNKFINEYLKKKFPYMWYKKIHGDMYQKDIADHLFCINSMFVAIEFKIQRDGRISITPMQIRELNQIKNANGLSLIVGYDENYNKILIRKKQLDYKAIFLKPSNRSVKSKYIKIDWDFEFNNYENAIDLISLMLSEGG